MLPAPQADDAADTGAGAVLEGAPASPIPVDGSVRAELWTLTRLSLPIALAQLGLVSMGLVDTAIVGRSSVDDLAGVSMGRAIIFSTTTIGMGMSSALEPLAAQAIGAGEHGVAWSSLRATLVACALVAIPSVLLGLAITPALVPLGVDASLVPRVQDYVLGYAPGALAFTAFLAGKTFLQAHNVTRPALVASLVANVVNAAACMLLVRGDDALAWAGISLGLPRLGAFGAGLSSSLGSLVLAAIVLVAAWPYRPREKAPRVPLWRVVKLGAPVGAQLAAEVSVFALVGLLAGRLGSSVVSAHQIALGLASFTFMGALGVSAATSVRVGHAIGAGRSPRRAGLLGVALGAGIMSVSALVFALFPEALVRIFTPDPEVIAVGASLLRLAAVFQLFDGVQGVATGALRGAGDVRFPLLANIGAHWFVGLPVALLLGFGLHMGAAGLWTGLTVGLVTISALLGGRFWVLSRRAIARV